MKHFTLSDGTVLQVCDLSTPTKIVNVFNSLEEAEAFQDYLTDELLTGAKLVDEDMVPPLDDMSYEIDGNGNVTARYFEHIEEPVEETDIIEEDTE